MSRKKKKQSIESVTEVQAPETNEAVVDLSDTEEPSSEPELFPLSHVARCYAVGFKESWLPGIMSHAKSKGHPELATLEECKSVLLQYGVSVK